jgi:lipoprotein-releasing system permease protein
LNFPLYIARRYLLSKSSNNAINIITLIATIGVIVSTIALFLVLSVFSGLKDFSLSFIRTSDPDLKITSVEGKSFHFNDSVRNALMLDRVKAYSKVVEERVFLSYVDKSHVASIKGIDSNFLNVNRLDTAVYFGNWVNYEAKHTVVVGSAISMALSIGTYDFLEALKIYVPKPGKGYITNPKTAFNQVNAQTIGIYRLTDDIDRKYVYANIALARDLLNYDEDEVSAVEIRLNDEADLKEVQDEMKRRLGSGFEVRTRQQLNSVFYKMLNTENLVSYLVFTLVLIIALFNVIGAIVMMIIDKRENLKTLYHLGSEIRDIRRIFVFQGFLLTCFGLLTGLLVAIPLVILQKKFGFIMITQSLAYPVEFRAINVLVVVVTLLVLGFIASQIASGRISKKLVE